MDAAKINVDFENISKIDELDDEDLFNLLDDINQPKEEVSNKLCKNCDTDEYITDDKSQGIKVCTKCGGVLANLLDDSPEWRNHEDGKEGYSRCNAITNVFLPKSSIGTTIHCGYNSKLRMISNWNNMPSDERSLNIVLKQIQEKCRDAGIKKCIEDDAKILYKYISESSYSFGRNKGKDVLLRCNNRRGLIAVCVFYACKRKGETRTPKEIASVFDIETKCVTKGRKLFQKIIKPEHLEDDSKISSPEQFISRYCRDLHINKHIDLALQIARNIKKLNLASMHTPFSVAISSILLVININKLNISRKKVSEQFNISEVTIVKSYNKIEKYTNVLINDEVVNKISELIEKERLTMVIPEKLKLMHDDVNNHYKYFDNFDSYMKKKNIDDQLMETNNQYNLLMNKINN
jgi:transcription initiation factor TFIIIB Brf1 subunit/transcription initiation factor TFIIB